MNNLEKYGFEVMQESIGVDLLWDLQVETQALLDAFAAGDRRADFWCYDDEATGTELLYRVHNLEQHATQCADLFADGILHELATTLIGPVTATACAMVAKTPGVAGVPWHRDRIDVSPGTAINLSIYLDEAMESNGCFAAVPKSHFLPDDADPLAVCASGPVQLVRAKPGEVLAHDVRLVHGSGDNNSQSLRRSLIVEFIQQPR